MIIDFHTHTFPDKIASAALRELSQTGHIPPYTNGTAAGLRASMQEAGVDLSLVLPVATNLAQVGSINASAARQGLQKGERGILSFAAAHPGSPDLEEELETAAALGFRGIKLHPVYQQVDFDDSRTLRILDKAGRLGLIVLTHAGRDIGFPTENRCSPAMIRRALEKVGPVKLVAAHMGGWKNWDEAVQELAGTAVYIDTACSTGGITPLEDGFYTKEDLTLLSGEAFVGMVKAFGARRVLMGSDSPWTSQKETVDWLCALPLGEEEKALILGQNARTLLGL